MCNNQYQKQVAAPKCKVLIILQMPTDWVMNEHEQRM